MSPGAPSGGAPGPGDGALQIFTAERARLVGLAYRMLGAPEEAEDVVQEAWIRWQGVDPTRIDRPAAWLTTVVTRLALDRLGAAQRRREIHVGPWIPEPVPTGPGDDPAEIIGGAETLTLGFLRVLETLRPLERAVFVLHEVFGVPLRDVAATVGRTETATRQIARRARQRVRDGRPRVDPDPADAERLTEAFVAAVVEGRLTRLVGMLTDDVVLISDGGPGVAAARRPVRGPDRVARFLTNTARRSLDDRVEVRFVGVNGRPGILVLRHGEPLSLAVPAWRDGRTAEILLIRNPAKLAAFHRRWVAAGAR